jgi:GNAT superfamily N-acetyltransferase
MNPASVVDLADRPDLIDQVGELRWKEWGRPPEPVDLDWWVDATRRESGPADVPVTFAAVTPSGTPVGAVGLGEFDIEERRDRSPWVLGMVVLPAWRRLGIGRMLLARLEAHAAAHGYEQIWVATGEACTFYQRCGWSPMEELVNARGEPMTVLALGPGR